MKNTTQDCTAALTETLHLATQGSVGEAMRHVRILEETVDPGSAEELLARQRKRSFVRVVECESGMTRFEALLDPERATVVRAALEATVAAALRARQYDRTEVVPADVVSVEQLQAHALTRLAEIYLAASPEQRGADFTAPILFSVALGESGQAGLAESVYGHSIPGARLASLQNSAAHLLVHDRGQPVLLDGEVLDRDPAARLASPAQRVGLAWRDKHCTYLGCDRPPTWSLHAHHKVAYSRQGPTTVRNLVLLCSEHHLVTHHPDG